MAPDGSLPQAVAAAAAAAAAVVVVAPSAIVDHALLLPSAQAVSDLLLHQPGQLQLGGSRRVSGEEMAALLQRANAAGSVRCTPAGSAANVARNLARLGLPVSLVTGRGADAWGEVFCRNLHDAGVDVGAVLALPGATGTSLILAHAGQRTMRTCLSPDTILQPHHLQPQHFEVAQQGHGGGPPGCWVFVSAYAAYSPGLLERVCDMARQAGRRVLLDLASFEVVRQHAPLLLRLLRAGAVHTVVCNEDEAAELHGVSLAGPDCGTHAQPVPNSHSGAAQLAEVWAAQELAGWCTGGAVVTLGKRGCVVAAGRDSAVHVPAVPEAVLDATGAGDAFTAGLLHALVSGDGDLQRCAASGCAAGALAVQVLGPDALAPAITPP